MAAILFDLVILLCLWLEDVTVFTRLIFEKNFDPSNFDHMSVDVIIDTSLYTIGMSIQLLLRLYIRYIKKVQNANTELISIKVWIIYFIMYTSYCLAVYEKWDGMVDLTMILQYIVIPLLILFNHSEFKNYYMSNHPGVQDASNAIWHLLSVCYFKLSNVLSNFCRSNQIHPHDVVF